MRMYTRPHTSTEVWSSTLGSMLGLGFSYVGHGRLITCTYSRVFLLFTTMPLAALHPCEKLAPDTGYAIEYS